MNAREKAVAQALERDGGCICRHWSTVKCEGPLDGDEAVRRSQGGDPYDWEQIQMLCRMHHTMFDNVMPRAKKILGYAGKENLAWEQFVFYQETPQGDWEAYQESWKRSFDAETAYSVGQGQKPAIRYKPEV